MTDNEKPIKKRIVIVVSILVRHKQLFVEDPIRQQLACETIDDDIKIDENIIIKAT